MKKNLNRTYKYIDDRVQDDLKTLINQAQDWEVHIPEQYRSREYRVENFTYNKPDYNDMLSVYIFLNKPHTESTFFTIFVRSNDDTTEIKSDLSFCNQELRSFQDSMYSPTPRNIDYDIVHNKEYDSIQDHFENVKSLLLNHIQYIEDNEDEALENLTEYSKLQINPH